MSRLSDRIARMEAANGGADDAITHFEIMFVAPTPDGPQYTGDVLVQTIGEPWESGRWEHRPEIVGTTADAKAQRKEA